MPRETKTARYLRLFFAETDKVDHDATFEVTTNGTWNLMSYGVVVEAIFGAPRAEQEKITNMIRRIDFQNGDVSRYLRHLGVCMARVHAQTQ